LFAAVVGLVFLASAFGSAAQEATFKGAVRTVAVFATVMNAEGRLASDLPREAFTVLDRGQPQPLTLFSNDLQPITAVMLLDRSGSMRANFGLVEQAAEAFVAVMSPADKARIGSFSNRIQIDPRDFTSDHDALLSILRTELQPEGPTPLWNAINVGITDLLHQESRRVILVFTDGVDNPENFRAVNNSLNDILKRADEEDVMVYAIGLAGQNGPTARGPSGGPVGGPRGGGPMGGPRGGFGGGRGGFGGPFGGGPPAGRAADEKPDPGLAKLAAATGGGYFELTSTADLSATFARVADELHHQYALGFTPPQLDGKLHPLDVRIAAAGFTVRARKNYLARRERPSS
jgi:VWFA-related protein